MVVIPYQELSTEAIQGLLEEYVTRDGTDYGAVETSLQAKVKRVYAQLERKDIVIVFDEMSESCNIISKEDFAKMNAEQAPLE